MASMGRIVLTALACGCVPLTLAAADAGSSPPKLSATQIVDRNIAARGGLQAWHAEQTMSWTGKMDAGVGDSVARSQMFVRDQWAHRTKGPKSLTAPQESSPPPAQVQVPFVLDMKRPAKQRVEIQFAGKTAVQVYDGHSGWLKRPYLNRDDWEPFDAEQAKAQASASSLDGPLFDYAVKGTKPELAGVEPVEGHDAYKLKLTLGDGTVQHVWIDAASFLDVKVEGTPRQMDGKMHPVWIFQRDFRRVQGVMVPFLLETAVDGYRDTHKMVIEKVTVNPQLDDSLFVKPNA